MVSSTQVVLQGLIGLAGLFFGVRSLQQYRQGRQPVSTRQQVLAGWIFWAGVFFLLSATFWALTFVVTSKSTKGALFGWGNGLGSFTPFGELAALLLWLHLRTYQRTPRQSPLSSFVLPDMLNRPLRPALGIIGGFVVFLVYGIVQVLTNVTAGTLLVLAGAGSAVVLVVATPWRDMRVYAAALGLTGLGCFFLSSSPPIRVETRTALLILATALVIIGFVLWFLWRRTAPQGEAETTGKTTAPKAVKPAEEVDADKARLAARARVRRQVKRRRR